MTEGTTLTNRALIGAVVKYKTEGKILTLQIEGNHLIALNTHCKINITGLDVVDYVNNNNIFNGTKIFEAVSNNILEATIILSAVYDNMNISLQIASGTPVVNIVNDIWQLEPGRYKIQTIASADVNWNGNKIKIFADYYNGSVSPSYFYTEENNIDNGEYGIAGATLTFDGYVKKGNIALQTVNALTNIPLLIYKL